MPVVQGTDSKELKEMERKGQDRELFGKKNQQGLVQEGGQRQHQDTHGSGLGASHTIY